MELGAEFAASAVRVVGERCQAQLTVTRTEVVPLTALFTERRHERDVASLCDPETALFARMDGEGATAEEAVLLACGLFGERAWAGEAAQRCLLSEAGPRTAIECGGLPRVTVAVGEDASVRRRRVAVMALREAALVLVVLAPPGARATKVAADRWPFDSS
jgi:hypothetical protein